MRYSIFLKMVAALVILSVVPLMISNFLIIKTYQDIVDEYVPQEIIEKEAEEQLELTYSNVRIHTTLTVFLVVMLVFFVSILVSQNIVKPIKSLIKGTKEISTGKLDTRVKIKTKDELEDLARFFNQMAKDLKDSRKILEEEKATLEIRVNARTKELKEIAEGLETQVQDRTKELEDRAKELEKFNKLAVGRELKMIELKRRLNRIEKGFGK